MKTNAIKLLMIAVITLPLLVLSFFNNQNVQALPKADDDVAATYKKTCQACHTAKAEKFYDPAKTDEHHIEVILKGKKGEKPPYMPGYEAKGMTQEQAKTLAEYMRTLRTPSS